MNYNQVISDLAGTISGIHSAFLYEEGRGILTVQGSHHLQKSTMTDIADKAIESYKKTTEYFDDIKEMFFCFKGVKIFVCNILEHRWLYVIYDSAMTQAVLQQNVRQTLADHSMGDDILATTVSTSDDGGHEQYLDDGDGYENIDDIIGTNPDLEEPFEVIKSELTAIIGPIGDLVFEDAIDDWQQVTTPSQDSLWKLAEIIEEEIGSADLINSFRTRLLDKLNLTRMM